MLDSWRWGRYEDVNVGYGNRELALGVESEPQEASSYESELAFVNVYVYEDVRMVR